MKGHEPILAMRRKHSRPEVVFVNDYPCQTNWEENGDYPTVCTYGDEIEALDLRFLAGCIVSVSATEENRAKALYEACKRAGAGKVAAAHIQTDKSDNLQTGWTQCTL